MTYRMADEMGIMIWQDFMFGGGVVPGYDDAFRQNVMEEARQQVSAAQSTSKYRALVR